MSPDSTDHVACQRRLVIAKNNIECRAFVIRAG